MGCARFSASCASLLPAAHCSSRSIPPLPMSPCSAGEPRACFFAVAGRRRAEGAPGGAPGAAGQQDVLQRGGGEKEKHFEHPENPEALAEILEHAPGEAASGPSGIVNACGLLSFAPRSE
jgi:hypothetical protein